MKQKRIELFNLKNKDCQEEFKRETSTCVNGGFLSSVFDQEEDVHSLTKIFIKRLDKTIQKCFKKIRVKEKKDEVKEALYKK